MAAPQVSRTLTVPQFVAALSPLEHMIRALDDEIEAVRRSNHSKRVAVRDGERVSSANGSSVYRFSVQRGLRLREDARAHCTLDDQQTPGVVLSSREGLLMLSVPCDMGPIIRTGHLVLDDTWLLAELQHRLRELRRAGRTQAFPAVDRLLGQAPIASAFVAPPPPLPLPGREVLPEQQRAVGRGLGSNTLYIWGPAGTGKSTTVADLIAALMCDESALLLAPTNAAVDRGLLKLVRTLGASSALERGEILRFGPIVDDELRTAYGEQISFDAVVNRRRRSLVEQLATLDTEAAELEAERERLGSSLRRPEIGTVTALDAESREATRSRLARLAVQLGERRASAKQLRDRLKRVEAEVLDGCRVLATTVHRAFLRDQFDRDFDAVIIDEAAAVMLPMAVCAASRARKRVILAGDFRQLPAPVQAQTTAAREWLARDVFTVAGIPSLVEQGRKPAHLVVLRRQFRMAPEIRWLVSGPVYGGALVDDASVLSRDVGPLGKRALFYLDTSALWPRVVRRKSGTRTNAMHAFLVRAFIAQLNHLRAGQPAHSVAVVTPYRGQVELIRRQLASLKGAEDIDVATVHRFQGGERGTVVVDLCDGLGAPLGHLVKAQVIEDQASKVLNVAFTRAKQHIVLVAPFDYLLCNAPEDSLLSQFLRRFRACGRAINLEKLLVPDDVAMSGTIEAPAA